MTDIDTHLHHHPCNYCGAENGEVVVRGQDLLENLPGTFQFIECDKCNLLRQDPRLDWEYLAAYYKPGYVCHTPQISDEVNKLASFNLSLGPKKRVDLIQKFKDHGNWLDVGCGTGLILQAAKIRGLWNLSGLEPVENVAKYTNQTLNIPIYPQTFEEYNPLDQSLDVITMWDVLEHLAEPFDAIKKVSKALKPNGVFVFTTPNLNSIERKIFKSYWLGYDLPRHLHLFPDPWLRKTLSEHGFTIVKRFCFTGSYGAFYLSLSYWNKIHPSKMLERFLAKGPSGFIFRLVSFLPLRIIDWLRLGTNITYVAVKNE